ncbi:MAG: type II toxin-antitoxin system VapC family toxin [Spirochaetia bacterium]
MVMIDSCVLLDIITNDPHWYPWSSAALEKWGEGHELALNPIIYSEISVGFKHIEELERVIPATVFRRLQLPWEAAFLAGKAFLRYRKLEGKKRSPLPDFYIAAHSTVLGIPLITRDANRFQHYFPELKLIAP